MKTAIRTLFIATVLVALASINANAIGKTEKGILIGVGSMLLLPALFDNMNSQRGIPQIIEPPQQRVIYRVKVIEKVYYDEPRRNFHHKRHHGEYQRYFKRGYSRYDNGN